MDYTLETAFCEDITRDFIFETEQKLLSFIQKSDDEKLTFENLNPYQRMLIHMIADHYGMQSKSQDENKSSKEKQPITRDTKKSGAITRQNDNDNLEESKQSENLRTVIISRASDAKPPLLGLTDYLTRSQKEKHEAIIQRLKKQGPKRSQMAEPEQREIPEDQKVVFKGRGKTRWNPDDIDNYEYERPKQHGFTNSNVQNGSGGNKKGSEKFTVKYVEKPGPKTEEITRSKNTRTGMLNRINNILQSSKGNSNQGDQPENQQQQKESDSSKNSEQSETYDKNTNYTEENTRISNVSTQPRQLQPQKLGAQRTLEPQGKTFLPSWNHMLLIYEVQPDIVPEEIISTIKKSVGVDASPRMHSRDKGIVVFDSSEDALKALNCEAIVGFKLAPFDNSKKDIFKNVFSKEFVNLENLRPKKNKDVAIRMINGHLNIKQAFNKEAILLVKGFQTEE